MNGEQSLFDLALGEQMRAEKNVMAAVLGSRLNCGLHRIVGSQVFPACLMWSEFAGLELKLAQASRQKWRMIRTFPPRNPSIFTFIGGVDIMCYMDAWVLKAVLQGFSIQYCRTRSAKSDGGIAAISFGVIAKGVGIGRLFGGLSWPCRFRIPSGYASSKRRVLVRASPGCE